MRIEERSSPADRMCFASAPANGELRPAAIKRDIARLGRETDQRAAAGLHDGETVPDLRGARAQCPSEVAHQRVVPAGIEEDDVGARCLLHDLLDEFQSNKLEVERSAILELGIHGHNVVVTADLNSVSRIEEQSHVRADKGPRKLPDLALKADLVDVDGLDDIEIEGLESSGHVDSIVARVLQRRCMLISGVADNERDALVGVRSNGEQNRTDQYR